MSAAGSASQKGLSQCIHKSQACSGTAAPGQHDAPLQNSTRSDILNLK